MGATFQPWDNMMDALAEYIANSPEMFPVALDPDKGKMSFVRLSREDYAAASFLDGRILTPFRPLRTLTWAETVRAVDSGRLEECCGFIFHIGHVGSTLLSRLMGRHEAIFSVREPAVLRTLAENQHAPSFDGKAGIVLKLLSRKFDPYQLAVVKTTSFVSEIAPDLLARPWAPKAIAIVAPPEIYLATILGARNSPQEAKMLAPSRLARLHCRIGHKAWQLDRMSMGEIAAMSWACEASAIAEAIRQAGDRVHIFDFDRLLTNPAPALGAAFRHFGVDADNARLQAILAGPDMRSYSKAPEHGYDAALRGAVLDQARRHESEEIRRGLAWIDQAAKAYPPVGDALNRF